MLTKIKVSNLDSDVIDLISSEASGSATNELHYSTYIYTANGTTTSYLAATNITADSVLVMLDGVVQVPGVDYTVSNGNVVFIAAPSNGTKIQIRELSNININTLTGINTYGISAETSAQGALVRLTSNSNVTDDVLLQAGNNISINRTDSGTILISGGSFSQLTDTQFNNCSIVEDSTSYSLGYRIIPKSNNSTNTLVLTDSGKHIQTTSFLIVPNDSEVDFPIGTVITIVNINESSNISITANNPVNIRVAGSTTAATVYLISYGCVVLMKLNSNLWLLTGTGLV